MDDELERLPSWPPTRKNPDGGILKIRFDDDEPMSP